MFVKQSLQRANRGPVLFMNVLSRVIFADTIGKLASQLYTLFLKAIPFNGALYEQRLFGNVQFIFVGLELPTNRQKRIDRRPDALPEN